MPEQLPLESQDEKATLTLDVPARLAKLVDRLEPRARLQFILRAPVLLQALIDRLIALGQLDDDELRLRLRQAERDVEEFREEQRIRAQRRRENAS